MPKEDVELAKVIYAQRRCCVANSENLTTFILNPFFFFININIISEDVDYFNQLYSVI